MPLYTPLILLLIGIHLKKYYTEKNYPTYHKKDKEGNIVVYYTEARSGVGGIRVYKKKFIIKNGKIATKIGLLQIIAEIMKIGFAGIGAWVICQFMSTQDTARMIIFVVLLLVCWLYIILLVDSNKIWCRYYLSKIDINELINMPCEDVKDE